MRSDTVTRPTTAMRKAMADAAVGDDVYGEDPTVNRLEALVAERLGKDAAVFVTSGTQANLTALLSHCGRGDEYIVGAGYHTYVAEAGGAAALGGIVPQTVPVERDGAPAAEVVRAAIKPENVHLPRSRLLALENTHDGAVVPQSRLVELAAIAAGARTPSQRTPSLISSTQATGVAPALRARSERKPPAMSDMTGGRRPERLTPASPLPGHHPGSSAGCRDRHRA